MGSILNRDLLTNPQITTQPYRSQEQRIADLEKKVELLTQMVEALRSARK